MEQPIQLTFRGIVPTEAIEQAILERVEKLERFFDKIESCRVAVEAPHRHHRRGNVYRVRIRLGVPGEEIVVSREPPEHKQHEDLYLAINEAVKEVRRQLEDYVRRRRGMVKHHVGPPRGRIVRLFKDEGYGFLETEDGREIYFHQNSVLDEAFRHLEVGMEVQFDQEPGEKGPQATSVRVFRRARRRRA